MDRPNPSLALVFALALAPAACATAQPEAPESTASSPALRALADAARAWQLAHDEALAAEPESFLTAVASHYLGPGQALALADLDGRWVEVEAPQAASIHFAVDAEGRAVLVTRGEEQLEVEARRSLSAGPEAHASFVLSPQQPRWRILVHDHQAPARVEFEGLAWFPVDPRFVAMARYLPAAERTPTELQTSRGERKTLYLAAELDFELGGQPYTLQAFAYGPEPTAGEELLVPFKDATTGKGSYAAGRYLELEAPPGDSLVLDFNRATNPLCAYSEHYNCPMPPRFNALELSIEAGARAPH